ncbi:hypothetical protein [Rhizobium sp. RAF56]|uniref:hypothetical protein n=1 Tax=Rhizobium sp. RAF56 TaxID=3233062 RepID=UPI003F97F642
MTGETREGLAVRAHVTVPVLKRLESPKRKLPDPQKLNAVKVALEEKGLEFLAASEDVGDGVKYIEAVGNKWTDMLPHARALLGHSVHSFAKQTGLSADSISRVEKENFKRFPEDSVRKIRETLSNRGVIIILEDGNSGAGVRFRRP